MRPKHYVITIVMFTVVFQCAFARLNAYKAVQRASKPNVIIILADDMGYGDVGAYNAKLSAESDTPTIDNLAKNGLKLTDFHTGASKCTPSRAALLTSRLGLRTGVVTNFNIDARGGLPLNEVTIGQSMLNAGYHTAYIGKWHLGAAGKFHPMKRGFQTYYGLPYSNDMGCTDKPGDDLPWCPACPLTPVNTTIHPAPCFLDHALPLLDNFTIVQQPVDLYKLTPLYLQRARKIITTIKKPFFLFLSPAQPHVPMTPAKEFAGTSKAGSYGDFLRELDHFVGDIVSSVKESGLENSTLIWFMSDNGPWLARCQFGGSPGPFTAEWANARGGAGAKGTVWEGGHRVPSILYWPGVIKPAESSSLTSAMDMYPTLISLAGGSMPRGRSHDGEDISDLLFGKPWRRSKALFHQNSGAFGPDGEIGSIRLDSYKAVLYSGGEKWPACGGKSAPNEFHDPPLVFNVKEDPQESRPLNLHRNTQASATLKTMLRQLQNFKISVANDVVQAADFGENWNLRFCCNWNDPICRCERNSSHVSNFSQS